MAGFLCRKFYKCRESSAHTLIKAPLYKKTHHKPGNLKIRRGTGTSSQILGFHVTPHFEWGSTLNGDTATEVS